MQSQYSGAAHYNAIAAQYRNSIRQLQSDAQFIRGNYYSFSLINSAEYSAERQYYISELRQMRTELRINQFLAELHRQFLN